VYDKFSGFTVLYFRQQSDRNILILKCRYYMEKRWVLKKQTQYFVK